MIKKYNAKVTEIIQDTHNVRLFRVVFDGLKELEFLPGQFFMLSKEGFNNEKGFPIKRAYSIASSPENRDYIEFCLEKEGIFTNMLFEITVGTELILEGHSGRFVMNEEHKKKELVFFAAGTGIAPLMSMMRRLRYEKSERNIFLFFGFRNANDFIYKKELTKFLKELKNFKLVPCVSSGEKIELPYESGRVNFEIVKKHLKTPESKEAFICGAPAFVKDLKKQCLDLGFKEENIHLEVY